MLPWYQWLYEVWYFYHYYLTQPRCQCECLRGCDSPRKVQNPNDCTCNCLPKYFKRCFRKGKTLNEDDCKCYETMVDTSRFSYACPDEMPVKWTLLLVAVVSFTLLIASFDCCLYFKSTGCFYALSRAVCCCFCGDDDDDDDGGGFGDGGRTNNNNGELKSPLRGCTPDEEVKLRTILDRCKEASVWWNNCSLSCPPHGSGLAES